MADKMTAPYFSNTITQAARALTAMARDEDGVVVDMDGSRAARLGALAELPTLNEVLSAWETRIREDQCEDYAVNFGNLLMAGSGELMPLRATPDADIGTVTSPAHVLPMTYRVMGNLGRQWCNPAKNFAKNMMTLPIDSVGPRHAGPTGRIGIGRDRFGGDGSWDSPRAVAYNAILDRKKAADATLARIDGSPSTTIVLRSRLLHRWNDKGEIIGNKRTVIGAVSTTHCLQGGDDDKLIAALTLAFGPDSNNARATAYRGVEESELRAVFPLMKAPVNDALMVNGTTRSEFWMGYITARNSESGAKSWSVSAGLYRHSDGAAIACEAIVRTGRHVGERVTERMVEVAQGAAKLLQKLTEEAAELSSKKWEGTTEGFLRALKSSIQGTPAGDGDVLCGIAWALGERLMPRDYIRGVDEKDAKVSIGMLIDVLGGIAASMERRYDARPIEVMLGRVLVHGWADFKAVAAEEQEGEE